MTSLRKNVAASATGTPRRSAASRGRAWLGLAVLLGVVLLWILLVRQPSSPAPAAPTAVGGTQTPAVESPFSRLTGRWVRPDGGYVLVIDRIDADGTAVAGYFNPKSIHVARAKASREGEVLRFFLELQDVNYPGSTYTLTFDPVTDELRGEYFQAARRQTFDVAFERPE